MKAPPKVVPLDWMEAIWSTKLSSNSKLLACYLRSFMNSKSDMAWPSYARIIAETGLSRATVAKYLEQLESEGWIARNRGHKGKNTEYTATIPDAIQAELSSLGAKLVEDSGSSPAKLGSLGAKPELVRQLNTNKQENKQVINNKHSDEDLSIAHWLYNLVLIVAPKTKQPNFNSWADVIRLMRERDGHNHKEIAEVFRWANNDSFWRTNILSPKKLRDQFATLHAKKENENGQNQSSGHQQGHIDPRSRSVVGRAQIAEEQRERERQAAEGNGQVVESPTGDIRPPAGKSVWGNDAGQLGAVIDGDFSRSD